MIDLTNIKTLLQIAGITQLKISFNGELQIVNAEYVFKGIPGHKQIAYQEVIDSLTIGQPAAPACLVPEDNQPARELLDEDGLNKMAGEQDAAG